MKFCTQDIELLYLYLNIEHSIDSTIKKEFNDLIEDAVYYHSTIEEAEETVDKALKQIATETDRDIVINNKLDQLIESNIYSKEIIGLLLLLTILAGDYGYTQAKQKFIHKVAIKSNIDMNMFAEKEDSLQTIFTVAYFSHWLQEKGESMPYKDEYLSETEANGEVLMNNLFEGTEDIYNIFIKED